MEKAAGSENPSSRSINRRTVAAAVLLVLIALTAVGAAVLLATLERSRLRVVAEYQAFKLGTELLRAVDEGDVSAPSSVPGLEGFGIYSRRGEAAFRYGDAPAFADPQIDLERSDFDGGVVTFIRLIGGMPMNMNAQRGRRTTPGTPPMPGGARLVYVAYRLDALRFGERLVAFMAVVIVAAIAGAFALLLSLAGSLAAYRTREARNRELLALGEAARALAHEIKNPLGVVKIQCAILKKNAGDDLRKGLRIIEEETDRLSSLASRVKAFLSADTGHPSPLAVKDALEAYRERYGDRIRVADTDSLGGMLVLIDPIRLDQIMDNLIANAVESMDGREFIPPDLYGEMRQGRALLRVADRGTGIADADKERVFDLFHTTKTDGAGIGLSLAKRYAESAEGSVRHEPRPGGGTIFTLDLPTRKGNAD